MLPVLAARLCAGELRPFLQAFGHSEPGCGIGIGIAREMLIPVPIPIVHFMPYRGI